MNRRRWKVLAIVLVVAMALGSMNWRTTVFAEETVNVYTVELENENTTEPESEEEPGDEAGLNREEEPENETEADHEAEADNEAEADHEIKTYSETEENREAELNGEAEADNETETNHETEMDSEAEVNHEIELNREIESVHREEPNRETELDSVGTADVDFETVSVSGVQKVTTSEDLAQMVNEATTDMVIELDGTPAVGSSEVVFQLSSALSIPEKVSITIKGSADSVYRLQAEAVGTNSAVINIPVGSTLNLENVVVDANKQGRVVYNAGTLNVTNSSLERGYLYSTSTSTIYAAGIYNAGTAILSKDTVKDNSIETKGSVYAAGIYNSGELEMKDSVVQNNTVTMNSGATSKYIYGVGISSNGSITLNNSRVYSNQAMSVAAGSSGVKVYGVGVYIYGSSAFHMNGGSITDNSASGDFKNTKGLIYGVGCFQSSTGDVYFYDVTISRNLFSVEGSETLALTKLGAGIYVQQTFKIGGNIQVADNDDDDLYFASTLVAAAQRLTVGKKMGENACINCSFVKESTATLPHTLFMDGTDGNNLSASDIQYFLYKGVNEKSDEETLADAKYMMKAGTGEDGKVVMQLANTPSAGGEVTVSDEDGLRKAVDLSSTTEGKPTIIILQKNIEITGALNLASGRYAEITSAEVNGTQKNYSISIADSVNSMETMLTMKGCLKLSNVTLNANGKARVISVEAGANVTIGDGATITGGYLNTNGTQGAGLKIAIGASATLENGGAITGNKAQGNYSQNTIKGIGVYNAGMFTMTGGSIAKNTMVNFETGGGNGGVNGGALYNDGSGSAIGVFKITGGEITDNAVNSSGGAIYNSSASNDNVLKDVTIENNKALLYYQNKPSNYYNTSGGAICTTAGTITISGDTVIQGNEALNAGGLYITGSSTTSYAKVIINDNVFVTGNSLFTNTGYGAGIYLDSAKLTINGGKIFGNIIPGTCDGTEWYEGLGGGIYVNGNKGDTSTSMGSGSTVNPSTLELFGGEITGNTAVNGGSGIYVSNIAITKDHLRNEMTPKYGAAVVQVQGSPVVENNMDDDIRLGAWKLINDEDGANMPEEQVLTVIGKLGTDAQLCVDKEILTHRNDFNQQVDDSVFVRAGSEYSLTDADVDRISCRAWNDGVYQYVKDSNEDGTYTSVSLNKVNASVTLEQSSYVYTGSDLTPEVTVTVSGETLKAGEGYTVEYKDNTNAGTASVIIYIDTVIGGTKCTGCFTKGFVITPRVLTNTSLTISTDKFVYNGKAQIPAVTVKDGNYTLVADKDYKISCNNNIAAGTKTLTVSGIGNYKGTNLTKTFTIEPASMNTVTVSGISNAVYTGKAITKTLTLTDANKNTLKVNTDYTVEYRNNTNAGTATVVIVGKGNYAGTVTKTFTIAKASLNTASVSGISNAVYTGRAITCKLTVTDANRNTLKENTDYKVSYRNNTNAGTATVVITGNGNNYTGGLTKTFTIKKANQTISGTNVKNATKTYSTTGMTIKASAKGTVTYTSSNTKVAKINNKSGKVTYVGAGTARITIKAAGTANYNAASKAITLKVTRASQKLTVTKTSCSYKASSLKKKKATFKIGAKLKTGNGKLTYKVSTYPKGAKSYISVSKTGTVTMKKNAKKGTYKVTVTAAKTTKYNKATKTITIKVK